MPKLDPDQHGENVPTASIGNTAAPTPEGGCSGKPPEDYGFDDSDANHPDDKSVDGAGSAGDAARAGRQLQADYFQMVAERLDGLAGGLDQFGQ